MTCTHSETEGAPGGGWSRILILIPTYGRGLLLPLMPAGREDNCRPDCVSLPRVITYGVNPAQLNRKDYQFLPKTMRVANINMAQGEGDRQYPPKTMRVAITDK